MSIAITAFFIMYQCFLFCTYLEFSRSLMAHRLHFFLLLKDFRKVDLILQLQFKTLLVAVLVDFFVSYWFTICICAGV